MDRLIIKSIEGRIMLGITMFISIMILVGWVAINEEGRMAEFVEQHEGRSIERGAELFAANCSSCHGINGYGVSGRAPGLNSPHFFGYDYLATVNTEIASLQRELVDINGVLDVPNVTDQIGTLELLESRRDDLISQIAEVSDEEARDLRVELLHVEARLSENSEQVAERITAIEAGEPIGDDTNPELDDEELETRLVALQTNIPTRIIEIDEALNGEDGLLAQRASIIEEDLSSAIVSGYFPQLAEFTTLAEESEYPLFLTQYLATNASRLSQIEFGGTLDGYITTTLIHGRPGSGDVWNGNIMVSWSQRAGGSLRDDQIGDIVSYILNWNKGDNWTIDDFNAVAQYAIIHDAYNPNSGVDIETVGTNVDDILANLPEGDATNGEALYTGNVGLEIGGVVGCSGCHTGGIVGPDTIGTWTRAETQRITQSDFEGYTPEQYLIESIVQPEAYIVPGFAGGQMNNNYGELLTHQELADIIAYLETQNQ